MIQGLVRDGLLLEATAGQHDPAVLGRYGFEESLNQGALPAPDRPWTSTTCSEPSRTAR